MSDRVVAGRFVLAEPLGHGGMGTVWRAQDQLLGRIVALKEVHIPSTLAPSERNSLRERVIREARAAAKLSHPSAVTVFDVLEEGDAIFIAMELVDSPTLRRIVEEEGPFTPERAAQTGLAVLDALEVAHANGIVHRDVKPANIMVGKEGRIKLADFGVASIKGDPRLTATGMVIGSPSYMSPEQASGQPPEPASDLWGLGATLYFATEGKGPFDRPGPMPTLMAITTEEPPAPVNAGRLEPVIGSLLAKDPSERPRAEELRPALEAVAANGSSPASPTLIEPSALDDTFETESPEAEEPQPTLREPVAAPPRRAAVEVQPTQRAVELKPRTPGPPAPSKTKWGPLAALAALLLLGLFLLPRLFDDDPAQKQKQPAPAAGEEETTSTTAPAKAAPAEEPGSGEGSDGLPRGWERQSLGSTGYSIGHPADWEVIQNPLGDGSSTRFQGPDGRYLLVDWTDDPGDDAVEAWEQQAAGYSQRHSNYREIQIASTSFQDFPTAAMWEWTYSERGADLHAANLGFADDEHGFALNFQTRSSDWDKSLTTFEQFQETFSRAES